MGKKKKKSEVHTDSHTSFFSALVTPLHYGDLEKIAQAEKKLNQLLEAHQEKESFSSEMLNDGFKLACQNGLASIILIFLNYNIIEPNPDAWHDLCFGLRVQATHLEQSKQTPLYQLGLDKLKEDITRLTSMDFAPVSRATLDAFYTNHLNCSVAISTQSSSEIYNETLLDLLQHTTPFLLEPANAFLGEVINLDDIKGLAEENFTRGFFEACRLGERMKVDNYIKHNTLLLHDAWFLRCALYATLHLFCFFPEESAEKNQPISFCEYYTLGHYHIIKQLLDGHHRSLIDINQPFLNKKRTEYYTGLATFYSDHKILEYLFEQLSSGKPCSSVEKPILNAFNMLMEKDPHHPDDKEARRTLLETLIKVVKKLDGSAPILEHCFAQTLTGSTLYHQDITHPDLTILFLKNNIGQIAVSHLKKMLSKLQGSCEELFYIHQDEKDEYEYEYEYEYEDEDEDEDDKAFKPSTVFENLIEDLSVLFSMTLDQWRDRDKLSYQYLKEFQQLISWVKEKILAVAPDLQFDLCQLHSTLAWDSANNLFGCLLLYCHDELAQLYAKKCIGLFRDQLQSLAAVLEDETDPKVLLKILVNLDENDPKEYPYTLLILDLIKNKYSTAQDQKILSEACTLLIAEGSVYLLPHFFEDHQTLLIRLEQVKELIYSNLHTKSYELSHLYLTNQENYKQELSRLFTTLNQVLEIMLSKLSDKDKENLLRYLKNLNKIYKTTLDKKNKESPQFYVYTTIFSHITQKIMSEHSLAMEKKAAIAKIEAEEKAAIDRVRQTNEERAAAIVAAAERAVINATNTSKEIAKEFDKVSKAFTRIKGGKGDVNKALSDAKKASKKIDFAAETIKKTLAETRTHFEKIKIIQDQLGENIRMSKLLTKITSIISTVTNLSEDADKQTQDTLLIIEEIVTTLPSLLKTQKSSDSLGIIEQQEAQEEQVPSMSDTPTPQQTSECAPGNTSSTSSTSSSMNNTPYTFASSSASLDDISVIDSSPDPLTAEDHHHLKTLLKENDTVQTIFNALNIQNTKTYLIGGAVRDALLGKTGRDLDFVTSLSTDVILEILKEYQPQTSRIMPNLITLRIHGKHIDIVCGRNLNTEEERVRDAQTRDYRCNSLYFNHDGQLFEPLGGSINDAKTQRLHPTHSRWESVLLAPTACSKEKNELLYLDKNPYRVMRSFAYMIEGFTLNEAENFKACARQAFLSQQDENAQKNQCYQIDMVLKICTTPEKKLRFLSLLGEFELLDETQLMRLKTQLLTTEIISSAIQASFQTPVIPQQSHSSSMFHPSRAGLYLPDPNGRPTPPPASIAYGRYVFMPTPAGQNYVQGFIPPPFR